VNPRDILEEDGGLLPLGGKEITGNLSDISFTRLICCCKVRTGHVFDINEC